MYIEGKNNICSKHTTRTDYVRKQFLPIPWELGFSSVSSFSLLADLTRYSTINRTIPPIAAESRKMLLLCCSPKLLILSGVQGQFGQFLKILTCPLFSVHDKRRRHAPFFACRVAVKRRYLWSQWKNYNFWLTAGEETRSRLSKLARSTKQTRWSRNTHLTHQEGRFVVWLSGYVVRQNLGFVYQPEKLERLPIW